jgi:probable HAF family extracellular repeat protein
VPVNRDSGGRGCGDQCGQAVDQIPLAGDATGWPIGQQLGQGIDELLVVGLLEPIQGRRAVGRIAQQALQAGAVVAFDSRRRVKGESPTVVPAGHRLGIVASEMAGTGEISGALTFAAESCRLSVDAKPLRSTPPPKRRGSAAGGGWSYFPFCFTSPKGVSSVPSSLTSIGMSCSAVSPTLCRYSRCPSDQHSSSVVLLMSCKLALPEWNETDANGINNAGHIVGTVIGKGVHGFLDIDGTVGIIAVPGAAATFAYGINNSDQVVGRFVDDEGDHEENHGFLYVGGTFSTIDVPGASFTQASSINDAGDIVGYFSDTKGVHGFLYGGGTFNIIDVPGAVGTRASGINGAGQIVGYFWDNQDRRRGFLMGAHAVPELGSLVIFGVCLLLGVPIAWHRKTCSDRRTLNSSRAAAGSSVHRLAVLPWELRCGEKRRVWHPRRRVNFSCAPAPHSVSFGPRYQHA